MAQIKYRANLSASGYPLAMSRSAGSVIIPGPDQNYDRRVDPTGETSPPGIPQAIYLENVLPTAEGYRSVGYQTMAPLPWTGSTCLVEVRSTKSNTSELLALRAGAQQAVRWNGIAWENVGITGGTGAPNFSDTASVAVLKGKIILFDGDNIWQYNLSGTSYPFSGVLQRLDGITSTTGTFLPAGVLTNLKSITASYGYLLLLKDTGLETQLLWSSLLTETDFQPSLVTGSGGGAIADCQGRAITVRPSDTGFYLYSTNNVVVATYTGNSRYPFRFKPVKDSGGVVSAEQIHSDVDESTQYYLTRYGSVTAIQQDMSQQLAPEFADFMEKTRAVDVYNSATKTFGLAYLPSVYGYPAICYVYANRYLCVSVIHTEILGGGVQPYNCIYIYDMVLRRYGRLVADHTHVMSLHTSVREDSIGLLNARTGQLRRVVFDESGSGVMLLGRFQYARSRKLILDELKVSKVLAGGLTVTYLPSENSLDFLTPETPYYDAVNSTAGAKKYLSMIEGTSVSILLEGAFDLSLAELTFHLGGDS